MLAPQNKKFLNTPLFAVCFFTNCTDLLNIGLIEKFVKTLDCCANGSFICVTFLLSCFTELGQA